MEIELSSFTQHGHLHIWLLRNAKNLDFHVFLDSGGVKGPRNPLFLTLDSPMRMQGWESAW